MRTVSPITRITVSLVLLTLSILVSGDLLGLTPGRAHAVLDMRKKFCETLAVQFALAAQRNDTETIEKALALVVERNDDVLSAALRDAEGRMLAEAGDHTLLWGDFQGEKSTPTHAIVPIFKGESRWGTVQVRFEPLLPPGLAGLWANPLVRLLLFVGVAGFISYLLFMKRTLRHLDPSSVIPGRVQTALDVLSEGVVLADANERIVLANTAFLEKSEQEARLLLGKKLSSLGWREPGSNEVVDDFPWERVLAVGEAHTGTSLALPAPSGVQRNFVVNAAPVRDEDGRVRGVLATFDDVTELEAKNDKLRRTLDELRESRDEVSRQNDKLQFLASRDPLTGLLNRRAFFERFERDFEIARHAGKSLSIIMTDIDHFKKINDTHGHAIGDQVIQMVSNNLLNTLRETDLVCRYGGEEFVVVLPGIDFAQAAQAAERVRQNLADRKDDWGRVTGSFGVATLTDEASSPGELIDHADQALYAAKERGRNQVIRWDELSSY